MRPRLILFLLFLVTLFLFTAYSYIVAKEAWTQIDFDTTVKLQDHIPRKFDKYFSYLSLLGSAEVTVGFCAIMALWALVRLKFLKFLGWSMIVPASIIEVFGKLVLFHPSPPIFLHRGILPTSLPSFYVHTDFSYPSGHMTRTILITTILAVLVIFSPFKKSYKLISLVALVGITISMAITRVSLGEHWPSDVVGGALLGMGMGFGASGLILKPKVV